jgi:dynein heavy chain
MQASGGAAAGGIDKDEYVEKVASDVLNKLPALWDLVALRKDAGEDIQPTRVVLLQEIERFNRLIIKINDTLFNLRRALKGEIGMSSELDELSISLFNGFLPAAWRRLAP